MKAVFVVLLGVTLVIAAASTYFGRAVKTEAGRIRLLPVLRPVMRLMNPRTIRAVERRQSPFGVLHHVGRRSGVEYHTPVAAARTSEGVLVPLMYGPDTDWCRNILAAGHCTLTFDGEELALTAPQVVRAAIAEPQLPAEVQQRWLGQGIEHYLSVSYAPAVESGCEAAVREHV
jgi:deazaflavin-dependent oxidoreductase (nitroreductase family)